MIADTRQLNASHNAGMAATGVAIALFLATATFAASGTGETGIAGARAATTPPQFSSTIGRTWAITEPDALAEIEAKVATLPKDMSKRFGPRSRWSGLKATSLAVARADRTRAVIPFYTLDFDIKLPDGRMLYPKGYSFNPLTFVRMPQRLVVVHPRDLGWALKAARPADFILVTAGDAIELGERTGRPIYILEERVKERLGLTVAPVIVAQDGPRLVLTEFDPNNLPPRPAGARAGGAR